MPDQCQHHASAGFLWTPCARLACRGARLQLPYRRHAGGGDRLRRRHLVRSRARRSAVGAVCDVATGMSYTARPAIRSSPRTRAQSLTPDQVYLDPNKHYFISVMPGDGINPTSMAAARPVPDTNYAGGTRPFDPALDCTHGRRDFARRATAMRPQHGRRADPPAVRRHHTYPPSPSSWRRRHCRPQRSRCWSTRTTIRSTARTMRAAVSTFWRRTSRVSAASRSCCSTRPAARATPPARSPMTCSTCRSATRWRAPSTR